jgi:hypothetical protein
VGGDGVPDAVGGSGDGGRWPVAAARDLGNATVWIGVNTRVIS